MKTFKKILNGCKRHIRWDGHGYETCGLTMTDKGVSLCQSCKGKAIGYVLKTKEMLEFLEVLKKANDDRHIGCNNKITECKEIIKLAKNLLKQLPELREKSRFLNVRL